MSEMRKRFKSMKLLNAFGEREIRNKRHKGLFSFDNKPTAMEGEIKVSVMTSLVMYYKQHISEQCFYLDLEAN